MNSSRLEIATNIGNTQDLKMKVNYIQNNNRFFFDMLTNWDFQSLDRRIQTNMHILMLLNLKPGPKRKFSQMVSTMRKILLKWFKLRILRSPKYLLTAVEVLDLNDQPAKFIRRRLIKNTIQFELTAFCQTENMVRCKFWDQMSDD